MEIIMIKRKIASLLLILTLSLTLIPTSFAVSPLNVFTDIPAGAWYYKDVEYMVMNGMMNGTSPSTFEPETPLTRGMLVTILWRQENGPIQGSNIFSDVESGKWYENAINWAASQGVVNGLGDGRFGPDENITREQMATLLFRYARMKQYDTTDRGYYFNFADEGDVNNWAMEGLSWMIGAGHINGIQQDSSEDPWYELQPGASATRAQFAKVMHLFCENTADRGEFKDTSQSNDVLYQIARSRVESDYIFETFLPVAWIEFDDDGDYIYDEENEDLWLPVTDRRVQDMDQLEQLWHLYMASTYPLPEEVLESFDMKLPPNGKEQKLYWLAREFEGFYLDRVEISNLIQRIDATHAEFAAEAHWIDYTEPEEEEFVETFIYHMTKENGQWKCSGIEPTVG